MLPRHWPWPRGEGWGSASVRGPCQASLLHTRVCRHSPCPAFHLLKAGGAACVKSILFSLLLSLYLCCLENRGMAKGKAGVQTALTASLCPGSCTLGLQGDTKTIYSEPSGESFSLSGSPATLEGWDPNHYLSFNACVHMGSLSWSVVLLSVHISPSAFLLLGPAHLSLARPTPSTLLGLLWWVLGSKLRVTNLLLPGKYVALSRPSGWRTACQGCS